MPSKNDTLSANTANQTVQSISLTVRISLLVSQVNGLEYWDDIITENRWMFSAKLENRGSHYNPLLLPAKFCFVEISPGKILWMRILTQQNFSKTKFHFSGCKISPRWQWNFSWLNANSQVHTKFCRIFARAMDKIHQILLSFLLHCTVSTVFHKPHSSLNVNVKINVSTGLEQGVADIQMHLHEWLQQWRQLNWWASLPEERDQLPGWFVNLLSYNIVSDYLLNLRKTWGTGLSVFTMA